MTDPAYLDAWPVQPYGQAPSTPDPTNGIDPSLLAESQAQQLYAAGLSSFGQPPNPQLVAESLQAGSVSGTMAAFSDPSLTTYAAAQPTGFGNPPTGPQNGPGMAGTSLDDFNWDQHWTDVHNQLQNNEAWQKFGDVPQLNFGYLQGVLGSDSDSVKKWQTMLVDRGFLDQQHGAQAQWDDTGKQALQNFYLALALPTALYSKSVEAKTQAAFFLNRMGYDPYSIEQQSRDDPSFQTKVVESWALTQGPDRQRDALHDFIDQFGAENTPQAIRDIANPGLLNTVGQGIFSLVTAPADLVGLAAEPFVGHNPVSDFLNKWSPAHLAEQSVEDKLTPSDKQLLDPALQQLNQSTGFLPFQWWDQKKNDVILSMKYALEDAFTGQGSTNPLDALDATSAIGQRVGQHHDDIMAGLFGDQWVKDHPDAAKWGGFVANVVDDPLTWITKGAAADVKVGAEAGNIARTIGVASRAPMLIGKLGVKGTEEALRGSGLVGLSVATTNKIRDAWNALPGTTTREPMTIKDAASPALSETFSKWWDPGAALNRAVTDAIVGMQQGVGGAGKFELMHMLHMNTGEHLADTGLMKSVDALLDPATDANQIRNILNTDFSHSFKGSGGLYNYVSGLQGLLPDAMKRVQGDGLSAMRAMGGLKDSGQGLAVDDANVMDTAHVIHDRLALAGVPYSVAGPFVNKFLDANQSERGLMIPEYKDLRNSALPANHDGKTIADVIAKANEWNRGRTLTQFSNSETEKILGAHGKIESVQYLPTPHGPASEATEESLYVSKPQAILEAINTGKDALDEAIGNGKTKAIEQGIPEEKAADHFLQEQGGQRLVDRLTRELDILQRHYDTESQRPGPAVEGQMQQMAHDDVSTYELAAALHPHLGKYEDIAAKVRADRYYSIWKGLALARPSTAIRIMLGDDSIRAVADLALRGQVWAAAKVGASSIGAGLSAPARRALANRKANKADIEGAAEAEQKPLTDKQIKAQKDADLVRAHVENIDFLKYLQDVDPYHFMTYGPDKAGYANAFSHMFRVFQNSPSVVSWAAAEAKKAGSGEAALKSVYDKQMPETEEILSKSGATSADYANKMHQYLGSWFRHPAVLDMFANGKIQPEILADLIKNHKEEMPNVAAPAQNVFARNLITRALKQGPAALFHAIAEPMIADARGKIFLGMKEDYERRIRDAHPDTTEWPDERVSNLAIGEAKYWMQNNLYQGQRTLAGRAVRHAFPFFGATANMTRFWLRQGEIHPWIAEPGLRALSQQEADTAGGQDKSTWIGSNVLSALGFAGQDGLQANLAHSLFLSADGIASFIPGFGPVFSPLMSWVDDHQLIRDELSQIPGIREQLDYAQGGPSILPSWIGRDVNALGMATVGHGESLPLGLGVDSVKNDKAIDHKYEQLYADFKAGKMDHEPTREEAIHSLGVDESVAGGIGALLPVTPQIVDTRRQEISQASQEWGQAGGDAKAQAAVIQAHPNIAPYLRYQDYSTPLAEKDQIAKDNPWVIPYAQAITYGPDNVPKPVFSEYDRALARGDLQVLGVDSLQTKIDKAYNFNQGWSTYNNQVVALRQAFRQQTGQGPGSKQYSAFNKKVIDPILANLAKNNPDWFDQFVKANSKPSGTLGLQKTTQPLRSLQAWEVVPQHSSLETPTSIAWRKALVYRDSAASEIAGLTANRAPQEQKTAVMNQLGQLLQGLATEDPTFAAQLSSQKFSDIQDIVNWEAQSGHYGPGAPIGG